jgi:hypothetical protein
MRCTGSGGQAQATSIVNLIIRPEGAGQISAGPTFEALAAHHRCSAGSPPAKQ